MPPPNPAQNLANAPLPDLVLLLLKQFQRLLNERDLSLTLMQMQAIAQATIGERDYPPQTDVIRSILAQFIQESLSLLKDRFDWTFAQALTQDMTSIDTWQTTADFIDIANQKSNAELRISAGATLLVMLGDTTYAPYLLDVIQADAGAHDVDAMLAMRALAHADNSDFRAPDWLAQQKIRYNQL